MFDRFGNYSQRLSRSRMLLFPCVLLGALFWTGQAAAQLIRMKSAQFDPIELAAAGKPKVDEAPLGSGEKRVVLIQWETAISEDKLTVLTDAGCELLMYVPEQAYIVMLPPSLDAQGLTRKSSADDTTAPRWVSPLATDWKLDPKAKLALRGRTKTAGRPQKGAAAATTAVPDTYYVQFAHTGAKDRVKQKITSLARWAKLHWSAENFETWRVEAPAEAIEELALENSVLWIEPYYPIEMHGERGALAGAGQVDFSGACVVGAGGGYQQWLDKVDLSGEGVIVQVMDDGLSRGDFSNDSETAHEDIIGRIVGIENATEDPLGNSTGGHGHINASIIMGRPLAGGGVVDRDGYLVGQGVAPNASVFATKIFRNAGDFDIGDRPFDSLVSSAYNGGARISSNSWGSSSARGDYTVESQLFDKLTRDADAIRTGQQEMTFFFSAGNSGPPRRDSNEVSTIGSPATGKNVISVGAAENCDADGTDRSGISPELSNDIRDIAIFSSRGPTLDTRIAPTLIAPGTHVAGAASDDPGYDGSGVSGRAEVEPGEAPGAVIYFPANQTHYTRSSGTSHSCPLAAGAGALFYEYFTRKQGRPPSPAMIKAALVATASDPVGGRRNDFVSEFPTEILEHVPNGDAGWGRVDLEDLVASEPLQFALDQDLVLTGSGQGLVQTVQVVDSSKPLKVVVAWTDQFASLSAGDTLVNDLDLRVIDPNGLMYRGNKFVDGRSTTGGLPDRFNNIEAVFIENPPKGLYSVAVEAAQINGDALPGQGGPLEQDFALFVQNAAAQTRQGVVRFSEIGYACNSRVDVQVSDQDLIGTGQVFVNLRSQMTGDEEGLFLSEVDPPSGILAFDMALNDNPQATVGDGQLTVRHGDTISVTYIDQTVGADGQPLVSIDTAGIDCVDPNLVSQEVINIAQSSASIRIVSDEPVSVRVRFGETCEELNRAAASNTLLTTHVIDLANLAECAPVFYDITIIDEALNTSQFNNNGSCFVFQTNLIESQDIFVDPIISEQTPNWSHLARMGSDDWITTPSEFFNNTPDTWFSPSQDRSSDTVLITPEVNLLPGSVLEFWHTFEFEELSPGSGFDGGVLEISVDGGARWSDLGSFITQGDYNAVLTSGTFNPLAGRLCWSGGTFRKMTPVRVNLAPFAGSKARIRFRLGTDFDNFMQEEAGGWHIDDVRVFTELESVCVGELADLRLDVDGINCNMTSLRFTLSDVDLSEQNGGIPTTFRLASTTQPESAPVFPIDLVMTDPMGKWEGFLTLSSGSTPTSLRVADVLEIAEGEELKLTYEDRNVGGKPAIVEAAAALDCTAPNLISTVPVNLEFEIATLRVEADEDVSVIIFYGTDCGNLTSSVTREIVAPVIFIGLPGLESCTPYFYEVVLIDKANNGAVFDNFGQCFGFSTRERAVISDDMEPIPSVPWETAAAQGPNDWKVIFFSGANSPFRTWFSPDIESVKDAFLITPPFDITADTTLSFFHTFALERGFDGAVLEISRDGGQSWQDLQARITEGNYNGSISTQFGSPIAGRPAWTGGDVTDSMRRVSVDLSGLVGKNRLVRFRIATDISEAIGGGGWYIDDFEIVFSRDCPLGLPDAPILLKPLDGAVGIPFNDPLSLDWSDVANADRYVVRWGTSPDTTRLLDEVPQSSSFFPFTEAFSGQRIYWRILSVNSFGSASSAPSSFVMEAVDPDRVANQIIGLNPGLTKVESDAVDFDRNGTLAIDDLIQAVNVSNQQE